MTVLLAIKGFLHLLFTFAGPEGHVARVIFTAAGGLDDACLPDRTKPGVHRACGSTKGKPTPRL
jgi:hypothetical protein